MKKLYVTLCLLMFLGSLVFGTTTADLPYTITNGTTADATQVQANFSELESSHNTHAAATTGEHGVTGTIVGTSDTATLSNKTLAASTISGDMTFGTGIKAIFGNSGRYWIDDTTAYAIESSTNVCIPAASKLYLDGGNGTYITESSNDVIDTYVDAALTTRLNANGFCVASGKRLYLDGGGNTYISEASDIITFTQGGSALAEFTTSATYLTLAASTGSDMVYNSGTKQVYYVSSSKKYKQNIKPAESVLGNVLKLKVSRYDRKDKTAKNEIGLIAEEVYPLFPEIVPMKNGEPDSVSYSRLSVILLKALQEQQAKIDSLEERIKKLEQKVGL